MATLNQRLASLRALRPSGAPRPPSLPSPSAARLSPGHSLSEQVIPLHSRPWLELLPAADPEAAALLLRGRAVPIPPLAEWLFLDLETTGLAGGTGTYAFLIGLGQLVPDGFRVQQFFLRDLAGEADLLAELAARLRAASVLVTYNGKTFDAPLLETRFRLARIGLARLPFPADTYLHLDLLYPARALWKGRWASLRLVDLEQNLLGAARDGDVPAELIPQLYFDFLRSGDDRPLQGVFRHNADDLATLAALAARLLHLLSAPEAADADPSELLALGRLHEAGQRLDRACRLYEKALAAGLPASFRPVALQRLSSLFKRQRDYQRAVSLWRELVETPAASPGRETLEACEELAICYEHRLEDLEAATEFTRRALTGLDAPAAREPEKGAVYRRARERFRHRLQRLTRKQARLALPLSALPCASRFPAAEL